MSLHHVLGVLEDSEDRLWATFSVAVRLADAERARLTLAKTTDPGWIVRWLGPFVVGSLYVPADTDPVTAAGHALARAAEFVPAGIPVTTRLLGAHTFVALQLLIRGGDYDACVLTEALLARGPRLRRELSRCGVRSVAVARATRAQPDLIGASL